MALVTSHGRQCKCSFGVVINHGTNIFQMPFRVCELPMFFAIFVSQKRIEEWIFRSFVETFCKMMSFDGLPKNIKSGLKNGLIFRKMPLDASESR